MGNAMLPSYFVIGEIPLLIDSGMSVMGPVLYEDMKPYINLPRIYHALTHSHFDHCGSTPYLLRKLPSLEVMAGSHAVEVLKRESAIALIRSLNEDMEKSLGITDGILNGERITFEGFEIKRVVKEKDLIELGKGVQVEVYEVPGHTRDSLCYRVMPDNGIFAGEAYGVPDLDGRIQPQFLVSYREYMSSLQKMKNLEPQWIGLAHGGVIEGKEAISFLERSIADAEEFVELLKEEISKRTEGVLTAANLKEIVEEFTRKNYDPSKTTQSRRAYILNLAAMVKTAAVECLGLSMEG